MLFAVADASGSEELRRQGLLAHNPDWPTRPSLQLSDWPANDYANKKDYDWLGAADRNHAWLRKPGYRDFLPRQQPAAT